MSWKRGRYMPWWYLGQMPGWPISCQYKGLQPQLKTTKPQKSLSQRNMTKWLPLGNTETVDAFSFCVIPVKVEKAYTGEHINVITQALWAKDSSLLQGLTVQNVYTKLRKGSMNVVLVVRNSTATPKLSRRKSQWPEQWPQLWFQNYQLRPGCQRGQKSLKALTHLSWLLDRDKGSYLKSWTWVG